MAILVSDTSVIIDLERGNLLEAVFKLPYGFAVPDSLYRNELEAYGGAKLIALGLKVETLTPEEVATASHRKNVRPSLSVPDVFAFALAFHRSWTLLAGDGELRSLALSEKLTLHGVLWLLDECETHKVATPAQLLKGLSSIAMHPRCRLPRKEITERLARWAEVEV